MVSDTFLAMVLSMGGVIYLYKLNYKIIAGVLMIALLMYTYAFIVTNHFMIVPLLIVFLLTFRAVKSELSN